MKKKNVIHLIYMSDIKEKQEPQEEEELIPLVKKKSNYKLTEARKEAIERMKEGRTKYLEEKEKQRLEILKPVKEQPKVVEEEKPVPKKKQLTKVIEQTRYQRKNAHRVLVKY